MKGKEHKQQKSISSIRQYETNPLTVYFTLFSIAFLIIFCNKLEAKIQTPVAQRITTSFNNQEREYYIHFPAKFSKSQKHWPLVIVHGGGGNGKSYFLADQLKEQINNLGFKAIIITPSFSNTDNLSSRFPTLGEGDFLKQILEELHSKYNLHEKILLSGYSRGGQFTHRFAFQNPDFVLACAPFAAGTWTTPKGSLLIEAINKIDKPNAFLSDKANINSVPERLQNLFEERVANVAGLKAKAESKDIPFLVMCGTMDPRLNIAKQFAAELKESGYPLTTEWTNNPHKNRAEYPIEFKKYGTKLIEFFKTSISNLN